MSGSYSAGSRYRKTVSFQQCMHGTRSRSSAGHVHPHFRMITSPVVRSPLRLTCSSTAIPVTDTEVKHDSAVSLQTIPGKTTFHAQRLRLTKRICALYSGSYHGESQKHKINCADTFCSAVPFGVSLSTAFSDLAGNHVFMCAFLSWLVAQVAKVFTAYYREGRWDHRVMFDSGGMPSSHTSLVVGLTTSIAHQQGLGSVYFPLALAFTLIVMYDAAGVRRHAGKQAEVLNKILADTFHGSPLSNTKLKEVLGHSPLQVICGAILGVLIASFYMYKLSH